MPDWPSQEPPESRRRPPRFHPLLLAIPVGLFLLFNVATGKIGIVSGFGRDTTFQSIALSRLQATATVVALQATPVPAEGAGGASAAQASAGPSNPASPGCEPMPGELYCLHTVSDGDSLASIATLYRLDGGAVPGWELLFYSNQPDLAGIDEILPIGQVLRIPVRPGVLHTVFPGDSIGDLAVDYDVTSQDIIEANELVNANNIQIGDIIFVPSPQAVPPLFDPDALSEPEGEDADEDGTRDAEEDADEDGTPDAEEDEDGDATPDADEDAEADETPEPGEDEPAGDEEEAEEEEEEEDEEDDSEERDQDEEEDEPDDASRMSWPVPQNPLRITNYMTARHPLGMDFGLGHAPKSEITAAAAGTVVFAGGDPCCSYGYYVIIDHGNSLHTLYAHFSSLAVRKGDVVARGEALGVAGNTGYSRGVHLHFEVRLNGKRVNPMNYLPGN